MPDRRCLALTAALSLFHLPAEAAVEGEGVTKSVRAVRTATPPVIDGRLDDTVWSLAAADDRFTQLYPDENKPPTEKTEFRILYDDSAVYVAVRLHDSEPAKIVSRLTRRDREIEADTCWVGIDSLHDHTSGFAFGLNAAGVQLDALLFNDTDASAEWDAVWDGETTRDAGGWNAEFRIPLSALRFPALDVQEWGFNILRVNSRKKEQDSWIYVPRNVNGKVSRFGHLTGLAGLRPRRTLELRPFTVARVRTRSDSGGFIGLARGSRTDASPDAGIDLKLGVTSDLTFDATLNPDFGQVEADQVVLNLSRFESFFPEKRPFFLEGTDIFRTPIQMFYSRRIGRPPTGASIGDALDLPGAPTVADVPAALRIWTAGKLAGKVSKRLSIGALQAITGAEEVDVVDGAGNPSEAELAPERSYTVLRGRFGLAGNSHVGVMGTAVTRLGDRDIYRASANHDAYAQGIDGQWASSSGHTRAGGQIVLSERIGGTSHATGAGTPCPDPSADPSCTPITRADGTKLAPGDVGWGAAGSMQHFAEHLYVRTEAFSYSPTLDLNDAGFVQDYDRHFFKAVVGWLDNQPKGAFQSKGLFGFNVTGLSWTGVPLTGVAGLDFEAELRNFWIFSPECGLDYLKTWDIFETGDGARVEQSYGAFCGVFVRTDSRKRAVLALFVGSNAQLYGSYGLDLNADIEVNFTRLELALSPGFGWSSKRLRFYGCEDATGAACTVDTDERSYTFADQDSGYLSLTARGTYTFSPRLSLQAYAQLFMARAEFARYRTLETMGELPRIYRDDLMDSTYDGDSDGDGLKDDDYQDASLNVNVVLRWEFVPGSTLLGVYTRAQNAAYDLAGARPRFRLTGLGSGPTEDVILVKLVYFWG